MSINAHKPEPQVLSLQRYWERMDARKIAGNYPEGVFDFISIHASCPTTMPIAGRPESFLDATFFLGSPLCLVPEGGAPRPCWERQPLKSHAIAEEIALALAAKHGLAYVVDCTC